MMTVDHTVTPIALSIVIASYRPGEIIFTCLEAIAPQQRRDVEVLIVDGSDDDTAMRLQDAFPWLRVVVQTGVPALSRLRGIGIAEARGAVIALLDPWCIVTDSWVADMLQVHEERADPVIGGGVDLAQDCRRSWRAWSAYLYDYWEFARPFPDRYVPTLPGINISYKRTVFPDRTALRTTGFFKAFFNASLVQQGHRLWASGRLNVFINRAVPFRQLVQSRFTHGRSYARLRAERLTPMHRVVLAIGTPLLPGLLVFRQIRGVLSKDDIRHWFIACLPILIILHISWALGEWCGYTRRSAHNPNAIQP